HRPPRTADACTPPPAAPPPATSRSEPCWALPRPRVSHSGAGPHAPCPSRGPVLPGWPTSMAPASTIRIRSAEGEPAMTRLLALVLCLGLALLVAVAPAAAQAPPAPAPASIVWKMGTAIGPDSPPNLAAAVLDKTLQEKSKGRMKIELHIANSLAKGEAAHLEGPQLGTIDIVPIGSAPIGGMFEPLYQALDLPFLWSSREQVWKVMDGPLGQELLKKMEAKGLRAFCFGGGWGFRNMMSNK